MMTLPKTPLISADDFIDVEVRADCVRMTLTAGLSIDISDETAMELSRRLEEAATKLFIARSPSEDLAYQ